MVDPEWSTPIVAISSEGLAHYYNNHVLQEKMLELGQVTKKAIEQSGKRAVLLASHSLSHRHFTTESELPEDMAKEHIHHHGQYVWDMQLLKLMKEGRSKEVIEMLPDFTEHTQGETDSGGLIWMMSAMDFPKTEAKIYAYGTVIGTGNAVVGWR
jgi:2-aminophenol/2-amino-5-chlorophenol 1,6-dioxygenase beta subunit